MRVGVLLILIWTPSGAAAQLVLQRAMDLGSVQAGHTVTCSPGRCAEAALHEPVGAPYVARVRPVPLRNGHSTLTITTDVLCLQGPTCHTKRIGQPLRWRLSSTVVTTATTEPGTYRGHLMLMVENPEGLQQLEVPVAVTVRPPVPTCALTQTQTVHLGKVQAGSASSVTVDPVSGLRSGEASSTYSMARLRITTTAPRVQLMVGAPRHMDFVPHLAVRHGPGTTYVLSLVGPGSITAYPDARGMLDLRLGGQVTGAPDMPPGHYREALQLHYQCH